MRSFDEPSNRQWPDFAETWIENWSPGLSKLSYPHIGIQLDECEAHSLGRLNGVHSHCFNPSLETHLESLEEKLNKAIAHFPKGAFIRLGSRSPKDTHKGIITRCKAMDGKQAIQLLTSGSARVSYDLRVAIKANYPPWVFIRQWQEISPDREFRCFMQHHQLIGVSQYFHKTCFPRLSLELRREALSHTLWEFFPLFSKYCHLADVVFDVEISVDYNPKVTLIEINPFNELTDPCLYSWKAFDFDKGFRIVN